jgi:hypothetical protein
LSQPEQIVSTMTEKLLTYALGRGLEYYDAPAVRQIARRAHRENDAVESLIQGIVDSAPFRMRRRLQPPNLARDTTTPHP